MGLQGADKESIVAAGVRHCPGQDMACPGWTTGLQKVRVILLAPLATPLEPIARVTESVDVADSKSAAARCASSSLAAGTTQGSFVLKTHFMPPLPLVTRSLMLVCTAIFCLQFLLPLQAWFALWPLASGAFGPWQMLTYAFLHGGVFHLFFNMLGLWMFGAELERLWGQKRFIQFLIAGALSAAVAQLLVTSLTGSMAPTVGASGALFALLLAFGMLFPDRIIMPLFPPIPMKARTFVIVFGALELVLGYVDRSGVAHFAHLGGMVGGYLMIRYWRGQPPFGSRRR